MHQTQIAQRYGNEVLQLFLGESHTVYVHICSPMRQTSEFCLVKVIFLEANQFAACKDSGETDATLAR